MVKNLPECGRLGVRFLGQEDSLGEGNGNPLQYYCLESFKGKGAWWATVQGVTHN